MAIGRQLSQELLVDEPISILLRFEEPQDCVDARQEVLDHLPVPRGDGVHVRQIHDGELRIDGLLDLPGDADAGEGRPKCVVGGCRDPRQRFVGMGSPDAHRGDRLAGDGVEDARLPGTRATGDGEHEDVADVLAPRTQGCGPGCERREARLRQHVPGAAQGQVDGVEQLEEITHGGALRPRPPRSQRPSRLRRHDPAVRSARSHPRRPPGESRRSASHRL